MEERSKQQRGGEAGTSTTHCLPLAVLGVAEAKLSCVTKNVLAHKGEQTRGGLEAQRGPGIWGLSLSHFFQTGFISPVGMPGGHSFCLPAQPPQAKAFSFPVVPMKPQN